MNKPDEHQLRAYLTVAAFIAIALGLGAAGYAYYSNQRSAIHVDARQQLAAVAELKIQQVTGWRRERLADAEILTEAGVPLAVEEVVRGRADAARAQAATAWMERIRRAGDYANAIIVDRSGRVLLSVGQTKGVPKHYKELALQAIDRNRLFLSDIHLDEGLPGPHMGLSVPLRLRPGDRRRCCSSASIRAVSSIP